MYKDAFSADDEEFPPPPTPMTPPTRKKIIILLSTFILLTIATIFALIEIKPYFTSTPPCYVLQGGAGGFGGGGGGDFFGGGSCPKPQGPIRTAIENYIEDYKENQQRKSETQTQYYTLNIGEDICITRPAWGDSGTITFTGETPQGTNITINPINNTAKEECQSKADAQYERYLWAYYLAEPGEVQPGDTVRIYTESEYTPPKALVAEIKIK